MAPGRDGFRFLSLVRPFMSVLPEVVQPDRRIPFRYVCVHRRSPVGRPPLAACPLLYRALLSSPALWASLSSATYAPTPGLLCRLSLSAWHIATRKRTETETDSQL